MTGYTRNDTANNIADSKTANASDLDGEFDAIETAFGTSGHSHDGTSGNGPRISLIGDSDGNNKVVVDSTNNRVSVFVEDTSSPVEQVRVEDGVVSPVTNNDIDLGSSSKKFKDAFFDGNVTSDLFTGPLTGDVTGDLSGNVNAASGSTSLNNVTVNGTLDVTNTQIVNVTNPTSGQHAATKDYVDTADNLKLDLSGGTLSGALAMGSNKVTGLADPTDNQDAATKAYVDTQVSDVIDAAPGALDTLNELAAALGDDANFSTTITTSISTKLPLAGGTMSGDIAMGSNKVTGLADPTSTQDATTKTYVDTADNLKLDKAGDTMSGDLAMGSNKVTGLGTPSTGTDATNKTYVDGILGSATSAASSASAAASSASSAAASYDSFDDRYLGAKASDPATDNDGDALVEGALYFKTSGTKGFRVWNGTSWDEAAFNLSGALIDTNNLSELTSASTARTNLGLGTAATSASGDFASASHTHAQSDITGLSSTLSGKADTSHTHAQSEVTNLTTDLAAKAPLASPALTGNPTAPTQTAGNNSTRIATTAYVDSAAGGPDVQEFTTSGTWTKPSSGTFAIVEMWGAGGGGGGGAVYTSGSIAGGSGGSGGSYFTKRIALSDLGSTETVTIGSGGSGGGSVTGSDIDGLDGSAGGDTTFGSFGTAFGGGQGKGGDTYSQTGPANGGNVFDGLLTITTDIYWASGSGSHNTDQLRYSAFGGGGGGNVYSEPGASIYGGGGGGSGLSEVTSGYGSNQPGAPCIYFDNRSGGDGGSEATDATASNGADGDIAGGGGGGGTTFSTGASYTSAVGGDGGDGFCRVTVY